MNNKDFVLRDTEVDFFHTHGFLIIEDATVVEEVSKIRDVYDRLFSERAGRKDGNQYDLAGADEEGKPAVLPQIVNPVSYAPELENLVFRKNSASIGKQLLGPDIEFQGEHAIMKPPEIGQAAPWHQDEAYWGPTLNNQGITCWMPFQDVNANNGCMHFIKNGHKKGILKHTNPEQMQSDQLICDIEDSVIISCPIQVGSITFHHSKMPHMTTANKTDKTRYALSQHFHTESAKIDTKQQYNWKVIRTQIKDETTELY